MKNSLAESNPDYTFNVIDDKQIQLTRVCKIRYNKNEEKKSIIPIA